MSIGLVIKNIRKKRKIKQIDFARSCGISQTYLSQIENDERNPTVGILEKISNELDIPFPVLSFLSLSEESISNDKKDIYKNAKPILDGIIEKVFL